MTVRTLTFPSPVLERLRRRFAAAPWATLIELAARGGYLARGAVYLSIGAIALLTAMGVTPQAQGAVGSMESWGRWPAGVLLLWLIGLGLYAFAGWRALQAVFDVDRQGRKPLALASRAGQAISGLVYGGLGLSAFGLLDAIGDLREADEQASTAATVAKVLDLPFGGLAVIGAGLFILGAGIGSMVRALVDRFADTLKCNPEATRIADILARVGYFGRGLAFLPAGAFTVAAGFNARASDARGLGGALEALHRQPFGGAVLGLVAIGLVAFGLFAFLEAWYRPIRAAAVLPGG